MPASVGIQVQLWRARVSDAAEMHQDASSGQGELEERAGGAEVHCVQEKPWQIIRMSSVCEHRVLGSSGNASCSGARAGRTRTRPRN